MKLNSENAVLLDCSRERSPILADCDRLLNDGHAIRVGKVDKRVLRDPAQKPRLTCEGQIIPAHVRRLHFGGEVRALSGKYPEARDTRCFAAVIKHPLHSQAYSQEGRFALDRALDRFSKASAIQG